MIFFDQIKKIQDSILKKLGLLRFREQILYIVIGFITTAVDLVTYAFFVLFIPPLRLGDLEHISPNIAAYAIAWSAAVVFSYFANRIFVFECDKKGIKTFLSFIFWRSFTLGLSVIGDILLCGKMALYPVNNPFIAKVIISAAIVILNYIACKFLIFKAEKSSVAVK